MSQLTDELRRRPRCAPVGPHRRRSGTGEGADVKSAAPAAPPGAPAPAGGTPRVHPCRPARCRRPSRTPPCRIPGRARRTCRRGVPR
ncbi:MAG: hypothetical protein D6685_00925 [Bacteroidetes bacterium]|nr:MAG: hypothetical protein D6685_00925 [Bacteroidota bacterium]